MANRELGQSGDGVDIQLLHDVVSVRIDGAGADMHGMGDLGTGIAFRDQLKNLALAAGKNIQFIYFRLALSAAKIVVENQMGQRWAQIGSAGDNRFDGDKKLGKGRVFWHKSRR